MHRDDDQAELELFFDCASPWSYIGLVMARVLANRSGARLRLRPVVVGGVFRIANPNYAERRATTPPAKSAYLIKDLADWSAFAGLRLVFPPPVFPVNSVMAMRACLAADTLGFGETVALSLFKAYFDDGVDLGDATALAAVLSSHDEGGRLSALSIRPDTKARLIANADELAARGGFGVPTSFIGQDMYFGADRLWLAEAALRRKSIPAEPHG
jgi:2-hydroxychromene-2-carboxylate isomerase